MLSDSLELNGIAVLWASDLLQTGFRVADVYHGNAKPKKQSYCIQGSHSSIVFLVNVRSLTGLHNDTPINGSSHYT